MAAMWKPYGMVLFSMMIASMYFTIFHVGWGIGLLWYALCEDSKDCVGTVKTL